MPTVKTAALWASIAVVLVVFFWLNQSPQQDQEDNENALILPDNPPDIYVTGMNLSRFDEQGNLVMTTLADSLAVYEGDGKSLLTNPDVILSSNSIESWRIQADDAVLYSNEDLEFLNNVRVLQLNSDPATQITSDYLKATQQGNFIETDKPVQIVKGKQSMNAIGMTVNLDTIEPVIHLLSDVSFIYDPS